MHIARPYNILTLLVLIFGAWLMPKQVDAAHIIGGVMTYECLGQGRYNFTLKVYRDCVGGGASFDSSSPQGIQGSVTVFLGGQIYSPHASVRLGRPVIRSIDADESPCLIIPPGVCVEEGVYEFELDLPVADQPYEIVYQRCCRNNNISNIVMPESTGATFSIVLTPEAQVSCNSSLEFVDFPPIVVCAGEELVFDHSARDLSDQDVEIIYSLCTPFTGGGLRGSTMDNPGANLPDGVAPDPEPPPPYNRIQFGVPVYTEQAPMGPGSEISIDSLTGQLTVRPEIIGQFVVGICAQEYVDSVLVSEIIRDFQFNVTQCARLVNAAVEADRITDDGAFEIISCDGLTTTIENLSTQESAIEEYLWEVEGIPDGPFSTRDLTLTLPDTGVYNVVMILNPNESVQRCKDTAIIELGIYNEVSSDFDLTYDTCVEGAVDFMADVQTQNGPVVDYSWDYGDGNVGTGIAPSHQYDQADSYQVIFTATDVKGCQSVVRDSFDYFPVPEMLVVRPDRFLACSPADITFNSLNDLLTDDYIITWSFGDGGVGEGLHPTHTYEQAGSFDVMVHVRSPTGCEVETNFRSQVEIRQSPVASFNFSPQLITSLDPSVTFMSTSQRADQLQWYFGDGEAGFGDIVDHVYQDSGLYMVEHIVLSDNGCTDTATAVIDVIPFASYFLPTAFTPNDDGINDDYIGAGVFTGIQSFQLRIYNRWGALVFESDEPSTGWNGRLNNSGEPAPKGVYNCIVQYVSTRGELTSLEQAFTLIR